MSGIFLRHSIGKPKSERKTFNRHGYASAGKCLFDLDLSMTWKMSCGPADNE